MVALDLDIHRLTNPDCIKENTPTPGWTLSVADGHYIPPPHDLGRHVSELQTYMERAGARSPASFLCIPRGLEVVAVCILFIAVPPLPSLS